MRWSQAFIPTLRDDPADAEAASHRLLVRAGYIRQLMSGVYSLLPLGHRVRSKIIEIIREELNDIGGQELLLPALHPREIWEKTGRTEAMADILFTLSDLRGGDAILGPTHEEIFATVATELTSYKQLPQLWYQIQTKFRDEARPKSGLLRVREFTMKDSYSFDVDTAGLDVQFGSRRADDLTPDELENRQPHTQQLLLSYFAETGPDQRRFRANLDLGHVLDGHAALRLQAQRRSNREQTLA